MSVNISKMAPEYGWWYILPSVEVKHKYWYLWQILLSWGKWAIMIELCRKDWNKNIDGE